MANRTKTMKVTPEAEAGVQVAPSSAALVAGTGGHPNFVHVDDTGTYIGGPQSWVTMPENIRVGGLWVQNTAFLQMLPSTMAFPVPNLVINPPIKGIVGMAEAVTWAMSMLV